MSNQESENTGSLSSTHYIIYTILALGLLISIFFNFNQDKEPIIETVMVTKCEKFEDLPKEIQSQYVFKQVQAEQNKSNLSSSLTTLYSIQKEQPLQIMPPENEEPEEEIIEKPKNAIMVKDFAKCYNLDEGSYRINYACKKSIIHYVNKHKDAKYFEIIGIVDDVEFKLYKNLQNNDFIYEKLGVTSNSIKLMKKLTQSGLAKHRAIEASWIVKSNTNPKAMTYNPHYHITSTEGKRGMLIRAYE